MFSRGMILCWAVLVCGSGLAAETKPAEYAHAAVVLKKYCVGCHNPSDREGGLTLHSYAGILRGGENGKTVDLGQPDKSRLLLVVTGKAKPVMPPEGSERPTQAELAVLTSWLKAGAQGPRNGEEIPATLVTPKIKPTGLVQKPVNALATSPAGTWLALGRHGSVEILSGQGQKPVRTLSGHTGHINDLTFSSDGGLLIVAAGEAGLFGEATIWNTKTWKRQAVLRGHSDQLFSLALSPDGKTLATGSYDQTILLWNMKTGKRIKELTGHNGPVFDLAFHPQGEILASASGDRTVKLWNIQTGKRLETFAEPEKEQYTLAFRGNGKELAAGGVDNRIRVWRISPTGKAGSNRLLYTRFAHEAAILRLVYSPDSRRLISSGEDNAIKLWETKTYTQQQSLKNQSDWVTAMAVSTDNAHLFAGRIDGSLTRLDLKTNTTSGNIATPIVREVQPASPLLGDQPAVAEIQETEPNNTPKHANPISAPGTVIGVLNPSRGQSQDADFYEFPAQQGETWILETWAAQQKSPADTSLEILHSNGDPVERVLFRAVRDSYITFRPIDSSQDVVRVKNWEEMELNQWMYLNGEVAKLFRMPQGPDSGFLFYKSNGKRRLYFDTSATIHATGDPVYIVEPFAPGSKLIDNGLPVFPHYYANDDDAQRKLGTDSRVTFTAPKSGRYVVRVTDVRGFGGKDFRYTLTLRRPQPDFQVTLSGTNATIPAGSGQRLRVNLNRIDHFNGPVQVDIKHVPAGYEVSSPITIEAGHLEAEAVIYANPTAKPLDKKAWEKIRITATAEVQGKTITRNVGNLGQIKLGPKPKVLVSLVPDPEAPPSTGPSGELVLVPGQTITAMLNIERNGFTGELKFDVDNLPHGVIVDNIGLSGVLVRQGETQRRIFLTAADWVTDSTRSIHAVAKGAGNQASRPLVFHVRQPNSRGERGVSAP